ncbi:MAG: hypothetical protein ABIR92_10315 [Gemmatimonadaceae bacterium]
MITHILFLVALLSMGEVKPQAVSPHKSFEECAAAAAEANKEDDRLQLPEAKERGLRYVCMKVVTE